MTEPLKRASGDSRLEMRLAGVFYLLTIVTGTVGAVSGAGIMSQAANVAASLCYIAVTVLLYRLFRPASPALSLVAALFSLAGCVLGILEPLHVYTAPFNNLVLFGCYCIMLGWLFLRLGFRPRFVGLLVMLAGLGWLTFLSPPLARQLGFVTMATGLLGEGSLTVWLLAARPNTRPALQHA